MFDNAGSMTRRGFAVGGAALAGTAALAAMPALAAEPVVSALPEAWDYEADLVVVGAGAAGYMAACAASEEGVTAQQQFNLAWYVVDSKSTQGVIPEDLSQDIVATGDTLEELARGMLLDPRALTDEVARYNALVEAGADDDFGKLLAGCPKIEDGPFCAVAINGLPYTTYGGIAVDVDGHVLTTDGGTIPALYAAGLCTGSFAEQAGVFYLGGMAQALAFGRQAGKNAAAETAWA